MPQRALKCVASSKRFWRHGSQGRKHRHRCWKTNQFKSLTNWLSLLGFPHPLQNPQSFSADHKRLRRHIPIVYVQGVSCAVTVRGRASNLHGMSLLHVCAAGLFPTVDLPASLCTIIDPGYMSRKIRKF